jgi:hypothetical protein
VGGLLLPGLTGGGLLVRAATHADDVAAGALHAAAHADDAADAARAAAQGGEAAADAARAAAQGGEAAGAGRCCSSALMRRVNAAKPQNRQVQIRCKQDLIAVVRLPITR